MDRTTRLEAEIETLSASADRLTEKNEALRAALSTYGEHLSTCDTKTLDSVTCSCGLTAWTDEAIADPYLSTLADNERRIAEITDDKHVAIADLAIVQGERDALQAELDILQPPVVEAEGNN